MTGRDCCVVTAASGFESSAQKLAHTLKLSYTEKPPTPAAFSCVLVVSDQGLSVRLAAPKAPGEVRCDFVAGALAHRRRFGGGKKQDLSRAIGLHRRHNLRVLDLTAGLGRDAFVLASLGAEVCLVERHPVVHALLADGLQRAQVCGKNQDPELLAIIERMTLQAGSAADVLRSYNANRQPDVIYIDPMFPDRQKSAKVKKEMQVFHVLVGNDDDADSLLPLALEMARFRVVVKRPVHAPVLAGLEPGHSLGGKSTRYDIYTLRKII